MLGNLDVCLLCLQTISSRCKSFHPSVIPHLLTQGDLSIIHINARSLHQNFDDITTLVTKEGLNVDVLLLSETWLKPDLVSCYLMDGYEMLHSIPADHVTGKGCAMYIKKSIFPQVVKLLMNYQFAKRNFSASVSS